MAQEFTLPQLIALSGELNYRAGLGAAITGLLRNTNDALGYRKAVREVTEQVLGYTIPQLPERKDYGSSSSLEGMPLFQPLLLEHEGKELLLESAVIEFNRTKNIVVTEVQGRDESVDEWINNGSYQMNVSGILCDNTGQYPRAQVKSLAEFLNLNVPIAVTNEIMQLLGIYEIVILSDSFAKTPYINCQPYSFSAKSSKPLPLVINDVPQSLLL